jgi:ferrous iron transport protein A
MRGRTYPHSKIENRKSKIAIPMSECPLSRLLPGQSGRVQRLEGEPTARQRLQEMGLIRGTPVRFVRAAPLGDPIEIRVRGYNLSLRRQEAEAVIVEREDAP